MSKIIDSIIGHAVGDAMGVPTEFCIREHLLRHPVIEMIGSNKTGQPAGSWSDDTSMEICTIDSFIQNGKFDYSDIMSKWERWISNNEYTANNDTFGVGRTCLRAIRKYTQGIDPLECGLDGENSNGNGSLMRILPVALYSYYKKLSEDEIVKLTNELSTLTHAHNISKLGCYIYVRYIMYLLDGKDKTEAYDLIQKLDYSFYDNYSISKYSRILNEDISKYGMNDILSTGYVVDTLECALWILLNANSYKETIIASTNIGNDTDTIGAIAGSMAGIIYGINSIPENWLNKLMRKDYLIELAANFEKQLIKGEDMEIIFNKISKEEFLKLEEDDLVFVTNPGRMGDEDGSYFIIKKEEDYIAYRVSGWGYGQITKESITFNDMVKQFPKWEELWNNWTNEEYSGKYIYIDMGFGNGLSVDKRIYDEYYPFLLEEAKKAELYYDGDEENYNPCINFVIWDKALLKFVEAKNIILK